MAAHLETGTVDYELALAVLWVRSNGVVEVPARKTELCPPLYVNVVVAVPAPNIEALRAILDDLEFLFFGTLIRGIRWGCRTRFLRRRTTS